MIYILAPYNLAINTTARNRILSFYYAIAKQGLPVKLVNPPKLKRDTELKSKGLLKYEGASDDILSLDLQESWSELLITKLVANGNSKKASALLNLLFLAIQGCDFYYPANSLKQYFKKNPLTPNDLLVASGFPYSLFKVAAHLAREKKCKLILDYRDPWTYGYVPLDSSRLVSWVKNQLQRKTEDMCLNISARALCDSESVKKLFPEMYQNKIEVILNGANLHAIDTNRIISHYPIFRIVYLGTLYNDQLSDLSFFTALSELIKSKKLYPGQFEVLFVGSLPNATLSSMITELDLGEFVFATPRLALTEAIEIAYTAATFLHLKYGERPEIDSSKHLDYLALQKPILLPNSDNGNAAKSIKKHNAGYVCNSTKECYETLCELWEKHQRGEGFKTVRSEDFLYNISREAEASKLVDIILNLR